MSTNAFAAEGVTVVTSSGTEIVGDVGLTVEPGQILGLVGETGAGKTVAVRTMLGLVPRGLKATGRVRFPGEEWIELSEPKRAASHLGRTAGLMLQNPVSSFDPLQRVGRQLVEAVVSNGIMAKSAATKRAAELCGQLGLGDAQDVFRLYPHELSGGMGQRVALALTLMPRPTLLAVDEPTSALDANLRVDALKLLRSVAQDNDTATLLISHDLGLVSHFCDDIAVLYAGHVVEAGPAGQVLRSPAHPYTRMLISSSLHLSLPARKALRVAPGELAQPGNWPTGCYFHPRCPDAQAVCRAEQPAFTSAEDRGAACHFARLDKGA
jgi:oligopeptide/dipeptide ABC transporter ATP-binding protein